MPTPTSIPVVDGLFDVQDGAPALVGAKCTACGTHYFPRRARCSNPACNGAEAAPVRLGPRGVLYSWSVQAYRPPPLFGMDPWAPYAIGLVDLPEGVRVMAMLTGAPPEAFQIGSPMQLRLEPLRVDADGREVLTWKFAPVAEHVA
ncbi:MAG: OB-fold domain-containing protein [Steroidobacteraceae bacterium]|jgi:uncharacterized OB-fold protein|nr:OB-fold domain-containing protein [Steroidobacteraceae bacterium]